MPSFCKKDNLAEISRKYAIPYPTLYWWVRAGRIVLPRTRSCWANYEGRNTDAIILSKGLTYHQADLLPVISTCSPNPLVASRCWRCLNNRQ